MTRRPYVYAIAQLPPGVSGLTTMSAAMVERLADAGLLTGSANTAPPMQALALLRPVVRVLRTLRAVLQAAEARSRGATAVYMSCDGGAGLALNILVVAFARLSGMTLWLHHHSFAYIDRRSRLMALLLAVSPPGASHIFLCDRMEARFRLRYAQAWQARSASGVVLSNAFAIVGPGDPALQRPSGSLVLGHLSNLTVEKGVLDVLALFERLVARGLDVRAVIAGPTADPRIEAALHDAALRHGDRFRWLGPVAGDEKSGFLSGLDAFVFPTRYVNEAQPLVLLEALAHGAAILAVDRGCIGYDFADAPGLVTTEADFQARAEAWCGAAVHAPPDRGKAQAAFARLHARSHAQLAAFLAAI